MAHLVEQRHQAEFAVDDGQFDVMRTQLCVAVEQFFVNVLQVALEAILVVDFTAVVDSFDAVYVAANTRDEATKVLKALQVVVLLVMSGRHGVAAAHPSQVSSSLLPVTSRLKREDAVSTSPQVATPACPVNSVDLTVVICRKNVLALLISIISILYNEHFNSSQVIILALNMSIDNVCSIKSYKTET